MGIKLVTGGPGAGSHNHGSGLGGPGVWVYMDEIKKEFAQYASAHAHYIAADVVKEGWPASSHSHGILGKQEMMAKWSTDFLTGSTPAEPNALDFEEAKPFIRAVIERMLDLLDSEEAWVKNQAHAVTNGKSRWCLIGAQGQAQVDLGLQSHTLDENRRSVMAAISNYLNTQVVEATEGRHTSMPSFNDASETDFEDVRLWLKTALHKLDE